MRVPSATVSPRSLLASSIAPKPASVKSVSGSCHVPRSPSLAPPTRISGSSARKFETLAPWKVWPRKVEPISTSGERTAS